MSPSQREFAKIEIGRALRDRLDEESVLALRLLNRPRRVTPSELCICGAPLGPDDFGVCGPCGRDRGAR